MPEVLFIYSSISIETHSILFIHYSKLTIRIANKVLTSDLVMLEHDRKHFRAFNNSPLSFLRGQLLQGSTSENYSVNVAKIDAIKRRSKQYLYCFFIANQYFRDLPRWKLNLNKVKFTGEFITWKPSVLRDLVKFHVVEWVFMKKCFI